MQTLRRRLGGIIKAVNEPSLMLKNFYQLAVQVRDTTIEFYLLNQVGFAPIAHILNNDDHLFHMPVSLKRRNQHVPPCGVGVIHMLWEEIKKGGTSFYSSLNAAMHRYRFQLQAYTIDLVCEFLSGD